MCATRIRSIFTTGPKTGKGDLGETLRAARYMTIPELPKVTREHRILDSSRRLGLIKLLVMMGQWMPLMFN
jgi:hypothetical protein